MVGLPYQVKRYLDDSAERRQILKTKTKTMYNTLLEKQAFNAKDDVKSVIDDLIIEIHELEEAYEKLINKIEILEEEIEGLKAELHYLKNK
jgi:DNA-binding ferritin-like protein